MYMYDVGLFMDPMLEPMEHFATTLACRTSRRKGVLLKILVGTGVAMHLAGYLFVRIGRLADHILTLDDLEVGPC